MACYSSFVGFLDCYSSFVIKAFTALQAVFMNVIVFLQYVAVIASSFCHYTRGESVKLQILFLVFQGRNSLNCHLNF